MGMDINRKRFLVLAASASTGVLLSPLLTRKTMAVEATNALENQTLQMYNDWFAWLQNAGVPGFIGETNTPNSQKPMAAMEVQKWLTLLEKVYQKLDEAGPTIPAVTAHCASITSGGGEGLKVYGPDRDDVPLDQRNFAEAFEQAAVVEAHPPTAYSRRGVNLSAGAFDGGDYYSADNRGTFGTTYTYPDYNDLLYLKNRGHNVVRMGFLWERVENREWGSPNANPPLRSTEVAHLRDACDAAQSLGMGVILDVHSYGQYEFELLRNATLGSTQLPIAALANLWRKLAIEFKDHPAVVGYDIMNEPGLRGGGMPGGAATWEKCSQLTCEKIAEVDTTTRVWVAGYHPAKVGSPWPYNGLYSFGAHHPVPWINSGANFGYTAHCYYGPGAGYPRTYDETVSLWQSRGY